MKGKKHMTSIELRELARQLRTERADTPSMEDRVKLSMALQVIERHLTNALLVERMAVAS